MEKSRALTPDEVLAAAAEDLVQPEVVVGTNTVIIADQTATQINVLGGDQFGRCGRPDCNCTDPYRSLRGAYAGVRSNRYDDDE